MAILGHAYAVAAGTMTRESQPLKDVRMAQHHITDPTVIAQGMALMWTMVVQDADNNLALYPAVPRKLLIYPYHFHRQAVASGSSPLVYERQIGPPFDLPCPPLAGGPIQRRAALTPQPAQPLVGGAAWARPSIVRVGVMACARFPARATYSGMAAPPRA
jgi:hypothetical protein